SSRTGATCSRAAASSASTAAAGPSSSPRSTSTSTSGRADMRTLTELAWGSADMQARDAWSLRLSDDERDALCAAALEGAEDDGAGAAAARGRLERFVDESVGRLGLALVRNAVDVTRPADDVRDCLADVVAAWGTLMPQTPHGRLFEVLRDKDGDSAR